MRGSSHIVLLALGLLVCSAVILASGAVIPPNPAVEMGIRESPTRAYVGETVDISYHINLTVYTHLNVTETRVRWDQGERARAISVADYPNATVPLTGEADGVYSVSFVAPTSVGPVFLILHAVVDGVDHFSTMDYRIDILPEPWLVELESPLASIAGWDVTLRWGFEGLMTDTLEQTGVRWDTQSHTGAVLADYPSESIAFNSVEAGRYEATITLPDTAGTIYYVIFLKAHGREIEILSEGEGSIICKSSPKLQPASVPSHAIVGSVVNVSWAIDYHDDDCDDITETTIGWSLQSHASRKSSPQLFKALKEYDTSSPKLQGVVGGHYGIDLTMPAEPCTVYYIVYAIVLGLPFMTEEQNITVVDVQSFQIRESPTYAMPGGRAAVVAQLALETATGTDSPMPGDALFPTSVELYADSRSHADLSEYLALAPVVVIYQGSPGNFTGNLTFTTEDQYFVLRCQVLGEWFWCDEERKVDVLAAPAIGEVSTKSSIETGKDITVRFTIANVSSTNLTLVAVHWDTVSHSGSTNVSLYPNTVTVAPEADGSYEVVIKAPKKKEDVYYVVHAVAYGEDWLSPGEGKVRVEEPSPGPGAMAALAAVGAASVAAGLSRRGRRR